MARHLPESLEVARAVAGRRHLSGRLPLAACARVLELLADADGELDYELTFERDASGRALARLRLTGALPLICQRTLERFVYPLAIDQCLGLITDEEDEAALPANCEPVLVDDGMIDPLALIEDELILALPLIPLSPGAEDAPLAHAEPQPDLSLISDAPVNPFAVLADWRKDRGAGAK